MGIIEGDNMWYILTGMVVVGVVGYMKYKSTKDSGPNAKVKTQENIVVKLN